MTKQLHQEHPNAPQVDWTVAAPLALQRPDLEPNEAIFLIQQAMRKTGVNNIDVKTMLLSSDHVDLAKHVIAQTLLPAPRAPLAMPIQVLKTKKHRRNRALNALRRLASLSRFKAKA